MVSEIKPITPFSPDYVSQIQPFQYVRVRKPDLKDLVSRDNIASTSDDGTKAKKWKLLKTSI